MKGSQWRCVAVLLDRWDQLMRTWDKSIDGPQTMTAENYELTSGPSMQKYSLPGWTFATVLFVILGKIRGKKRSLNELQLGLNRVKQTALFCLEICGNYMSHNKNRQVTSTDFSFNFHSVIVGLYFQSIYSQSLSPIKPPPSLKCSTTCQCFPDKEGWGCSLLITTTPWMLFQRRCCVAGTSSCAIWLID